MEKEGESYLDQLLNTVAPDWEENSDSPDLMSGMMGDEMSLDEVSLEDALSVLNDLPDTEGEQEEDSDVGGELFDLLADMPSDLGEGASEEIPQAEDKSDTSLPEMDDLMAVQDMTEEALPDSGEDIMAVEDTMPDEDVMAVEDMVPDEGMMPEEDVMAVEDTVSDEGMMPEEDIVTSGDTSQQEGRPASQDSVDVDDIFQDALSAVGYSGNEEEDLFSMDDMAELMDGPDEGITSVPAADPTAGTNSKRAKSGPGFFARIFGNVITDSTADEEEKAREAELAAKAKKAAKKEEKRKEAELSKEEKAQLSQEQKERKKQLKAEQAAKKAELKEEKKRRKQELAAEAANEVVGKINPVGATIVVIFFVTIGAFTIFGSRLLSRNMSLNDAENYFASGDYIEAYDAISNVNIKEDDEVLYRRVRMCSQMQKELNSYTNYNSMNMRLEALDALIKGVRYCEMNKADADSLGIIGQVNNLESQILTNLTNDFGVSETQAKELLAVGDQAEYTGQLESIVSRTQPAQ